MAEVVTSMPLNVFLCPGWNSWCERCKQRRAGYTFRWYSSFWHEDYMRIPKKRGAWEPGMNEEEAARKPWENFTGNLVDPCGNIVKDLPLN